MRARAFAAAVLCAGATLFAGCELGPPEAEPADGQPSSAELERLLEQAPEPPVADPVRAQDERAALTAFAGAWGRRTAPDATAELVALSAGSLHEVMARGSTAPAPDVAARGERESPSSETLEGILQRPGKPALVVTRTVTLFEDGGEQTLYSLYLAHAERIDGAWKVVQWTSVQ